MELIYMLMGGCRMKEDEVEEKEEEEEEEEKRRRRGSYSWFEALLPPDKN